MSVIHAYVDESGDLSRNPKASRFFVLGAVLIQHEDLGRAAELVDTIRKATGRQSGQRLRFNQMKANHKLAAVECLGDADFLSVLAVVVSKSALRPDGLDENNRMHRYSTRLLLERLSWHGSSQHPVDVKISHLKRMKKAAFEEYLYARRRGTSKIRWKHLTKTVPTITNEASEPLLQLADLAASAVAMAFNTPGAEMPSAIAALSRRLGRGVNGDRLDAYGLKVLPGGKIARQRFPWLVELGLVPA
jgi:hypothetical protein